MLKFICDVCGEQFEGVKSRRRGNHCEGCAGWMRALGQGPFQDHKYYENGYNKLGAVISLLFREGKLRITA